METVFVEVVKFGIDMLYYTKLETEEDSFGFVPCVMGKGTGLGHQDYRSNA